MIGEFDKQLKEAFKLEDKGYVLGIQLQDEILVKIKARNVANNKPVDQLSGKWSNIDKFTKMSVQ